MYAKWGYECILVKIYILHLRQDNIVTHIGHHGCVYDIISSNVCEVIRSEVIRSEETFTIQVTHTSNTW